MSATQPLLYEKVARLVSAQIASGALRSNDRIPSVRAMSRTARVSIATVVQAYIQLESAGLIESRPQSGFYVRASTLPPPKPHAQKITKPRSVSAEVLDTCREALRRADIVPLNGAFTSPDLYPHHRLNSLIREVLRRYPHHAGELVIPPGDADLRREIAKRMALAGAPTDPEEIVITAGTMDAITLSLRVICAAGDTVLVESPTYFGVLQAMEYLGLKVIEVPNHAGHGIDVDAVRRAVRTTRVSAAVLMPNFNNPVGSLTPDNAKRELVEILIGAGIPIIEDDIYGDLHYGAERPRSLRSFDDSGLVVSCGSVSKTIALGYRIGWAVSGQLHQEIARAKFLTAVACPTLQQRVLARYYASGGYDRYLRRVRLMLATNAQRFSESISRHFPERTRVSRPAGGLVLWVELPERVDGTDLFRTALASRIGISPGLIFSAKAHYRNYIRLNCGLPWSTTVERALEKLGRMVGT